MVQAASAAAAASLAGKTLFITGASRGIGKAIALRAARDGANVVGAVTILVMVYLGGVGSISGSILGATLFTVLMEMLRPFGVWRMILMPLLLVLLMLFRPRGILGFRELRWLVPSAERTGRAA